MLPRNVMPVVNHLRERVKRPKRYPTLKKEFVGGNQVLRFGRSNKCPLGLLPGATNTIPVCRQDFRIPPGDLTDKQLFNFYGWWDRQRDPEVMDLIWPKEVK